MRLILLLMAVPILLSSLLSDEGEAQNTPDGWRNEPLVLGEKLTYSISWKGIYAGKATLSIDERLATFRKRECYVFRSTTRSSDFISTFYEVNDRVTTLIDRETLKPLKFSKKLREGSHRTYQLIYFHPDEGYIAYYKRKGNRYVLRKEYESIEGKVYDVLSALIYLRTAPLNGVGDEATIKVCTGKRIVEVTFKVKEEKRITVKAGTFRAFHITTSFKIEKEASKRLGKDEGLFVSDEVGEVWFDAESRRPLLMTVDVPIGSARVELTRFRFPVSRPSEEMEEGASNGKESDSERDTQKNRR